MRRPRYLWRQLTPEQRVGLLAWRKQHERPWHSPPHVLVNRNGFHLSAACYEHQTWIGLSSQRLNAFADALLTCLLGAGATVEAWCVLPNHYHVLVSTANNLALIATLGRFHGRTSHVWNGEDDCRGRTVFFRLIDKAVRSSRHFWATLNYIHNNPVHHGYVNRWQDWPWSSARSYLQSVGDVQARQTWNAYPVLGMGRHWDEPEI